MTSEVMAWVWGSSTLLSMTKPTKLARIQAASAVYDLVVAGIFAFPVLAALYLNVALRSLHDWMGTPGFFPEFESFHVLFVNLFGGFTLIWSTLRIIRSHEALLAVCDALLRLYFAALMLTYVAIWGAPSILYAFVASELVWGAVLLRVAAR